MLYRLIIQNYKSFKEKVELSMIPSSDSIHVSSEIEKIPVLQDALIYGANASGKSNLIKALAFVQNLVMDNDSLIKHGNDSYKFEKESINSPSYFVLEIITDGQLYQYGIVVSFKDSTVKDEWLRVYDCENSQWRTIYETKRGNIAAEGADIDSSNIDRANIYLEDNSSKGNCLLLTSLSDKPLKDDLLSRSVRDVYQWIKELVILFPNTQYNLLGAVAHDIDAVNDTYRKYFNMFDIDIDKIVLNDVDTSSIDFPSPLVADIKKSLGKRGKGFAMVHSPKDDYLVSLNDLGEICAKKVGFMHRYSHDASPLSKDEESDGTNRLMDLIPLLGNIVDNGRVAIIDEVNRSLHSLLTHKFLKTFMDQISSKENKVGQLICTTHDILLLDSGMFGKKEIWFLDKREGKSFLYPLDKFNLKKGIKELGRNYLLGRFNGIPNISNIANHGDFA